jgi:hypothetical protein
VNLDYFGQNINPAGFRRGFGMLSVLIRVFDFLRAWSTRALCLLILRAQLRQAKLPEDVKKSIYARAKEDPSIDLRFAVPPKVAHTRRLDRDATKPAPKSIEQRSESFYVRGRKNSDVEGGLKRPVSIEQGSLASIFAQVHQAQDRSVRYHSRRGMGVGLLDENFEEADNAG